MKTAVLCALLAVLSQSCSDLTCPFVAVPVAPAAAVVLLLLSCCRAAAAAAVVRPGALPPPPSPTIVIAVLFAGVSCQCLIVAIVLSSWCKLLYWPLIVSGVAC